MKKEQGFTIPELLVAVFAFSLVIGGAANLLFTGIAAQRNSLATAELIDQVSFAAEYMTRSLRQAQKELGTPPVCLSARGLNYEVTQGGKGVKFLNIENQCQEFFLGGTRIKERLGTKEEFLTSDNLQVTAFQFVVQGESQGDNIQPRATFLIQAQGIGSKPESKPTIQLQTTVSQRKADVTN
jgi:prepilin-type N-terminal cleavage/methylation domain-containing protein